MTSVDLGLSIACGIQLFWMTLLTVAYVQLRHRHDRLLDRMAGLAKSVNKTSRMRHTGSQPAVTGTQTRISRPPFPVDPPSTNPIQPAPGRHSSL